MDTKFGTFLFEGKASLKKRARTLFRKESGFFPNEYFETIFEMKWTFSVHHYDIFHKKSQFFFAKKSKKITFSFELW
jgi:hypothetical protein